jgi:hypothetical protein
MVLSMRPISATAWASLVGRSSTQSVLIINIAWTRPSLSEPARTEINLQFEHAGTDAFDVRHIAEGEPGQDCRYLGRGRRV